MFEICILLLEIIWIKLKSDSIILKSGPYLKTILKKT